MILNLYGTVLDYAWIIVNLRSLLQILIPEISRTFVILDHRLDLWRAS